MAPGYCGQRVRKQVTVVLPADEWRVLRDEAARQRLPMTELCRRWLRPSLDRVRSTPVASRADDPRRPPQGAQERSRSF